MPANPLNTDDFGGDLYNLAISQKARPLLEAVRRFLDDEVRPMEEKFFALDDQKPRR